jgi:hypothetical protein
MSWCPGKRKIATRVTPSPFNTTQTSQPPNLADLNKEDYAIFTPLRRLRRWPQVGVGSFRLAGPEK